VIAVEAEDLRIEEKWKVLLLIGGNLKSDLDCVVAYSDNLPNIDRTTPIKVEHSDGFSHITIPLTYKKKEEKEEKKEKKGNKDEFDFDIGVLSFVKSLEAGKEWTKLENDNPPYYYFLHTLMRLTHECYR